MEAAPRPTAGLAGEVGDGVIRVQYSNGSDGE
jgi:hypothetical protein